MFHIEKTTLINTYNKPSEWIYFSVCQTLFGQTTGAYIYCNMILKRGIENPIIGLLCSDCEGFEIEQFDLQHSCAACML